MNASTNRQIHWTDSYVLFVMQKELGNTLYEGLAVMFPICLLMLFANSLNIISSFLAIFTVGSVVTQVMGTFKIIGWELGLLECLAGNIFNIILAKIDEKLRPKIPRHHAFLFQLSACTRNALVQETLTRAGP